METWQTGDLVSSPSMDRQCPPFIRHRRERDGQRLQQHHHQNHHHQRRLHRRRQRARRASEEPPPEAREPANGGGPHPPGARQSRSSRCAAREIDGARQWLRGPSGSVASGAPPPGLCLPGHPRRGTWRRLERQPQRAPNGPKLSRVGALLHPTLALAPSHPPVRHENTVIQSLKVPP